MVLHHTFFLQLGNIWTTAPTRWTNIMATSFPWFQSLTFSSSETSAVYRLWRPGLVTTDREWIWDDSWDTWNYPSSQANALRTGNFKCWNSRWTLRLFFGCRRPVFILYFVLVLLCSFTFKYVWPWIFHSFSTFCQWREKQPCPKRRTYTLHNSVGPIRWRVHVRLYKLLYNRNAWVAYKQHIRDAL